MESKRKLMFSRPASVELQSVFLELQSQKDTQAAAGEVEKLIAALEKLCADPYLGYQVPRGQPAVNHGRVVAHRGLRLYEAEDFLAYYKASSTEVHIYDVFRRGTRYQSIVERDLSEA